MAEFFNMGGYAFFVWTSYGLSAVVLLINVVLPTLQEKTIKQTLARRYRREAALKQQRES